MSKRGKSTRKKKSTQLQSGTQPGNERQQGYHLMSNYLRVSQAQKILSGELLPSNFKFREQEIKTIQKSIEEFLGKEKTTKPKIIMITGSPGAGKTLSTNFVLKKCAYKVVALNSNMIKRKKDVQSILAEELLQQEIDDKDLTTFKIISSLQKLKNPTPCILYIEEVQLFFNSTREFLSEDFFSIFSHKNLKIMLIGISNTIDALEKYGPKLNVLPSQVTNIVFNPYSVNEIKWIIEDKVSAVSQKTGIKLDLNQKLIKFAVNKINEMKKGDMRMVFQFLKALSRQVFPKIQKVDDEFSDQIQVNIKHIQTAFQLVKVHKVKLINQLPFQQQAILIAFFIIISELDTICVTEDELKKQAKKIYEEILLEPKKDISQQLAQLQMYGFLEIKKKMEGRLSIIRYLLKIPLQDIKYSFIEHQILGRFFK